MTLSVKYATRLPEQLKLFDAPDMRAIPSVATARNFFGQAAEKIVCKALDLCPIPIDGRFDVCFDAQDLVSGVFYEIKSVRRKRAVPIWNWRIKKDREAGVDLRYAFFVHNVSDVHNTQELWEKLSERTLQLVVVPMCRVEQLHQDCTTKTVFSSKIAGHNRPGYREGYKNIKVSNLLEGEFICWDREIILYGQEISLRIQIRV